MHSTPSSEPEPPGSAFGEPMGEPSPAGFPSAGPSAAEPGVPDSPYGAVDTERWVPEPDKRPGRTAFQRDRARVLHSAALRRLAGKTQVVAPGTPAGAWDDLPGSPSVPEADSGTDPYRGPDGGPESGGERAAAQGGGFRGGHAWDVSPRTRLTHSLECAQVGRELGAALGCDPDLVEVACLAHDLGHPPFGHNGERALSAIAEPCGGFEGNAQSLRLLSRLEPKRFVPTGSSRASGDDQRSVGLNLTRAALDAAAKYPWRRGAHPTDPSSPKFGVYEDDLAVFGWFRQGAPGQRRCFEAQVMDWSDDVAYSVHDVEDGLNAGHLDPGALLADPERRALFEVAAGRYASGADQAELGEALDRLLAQDWWPHRYDGSALAQARLKDATSQLIGRFCTTVERATRSAYGPGRLSRYSAELVVPRWVRMECAVLKAVADLYVMQRPDLERLRAEQRVILSELAEALQTHAPMGLDPQYQALYEEADGERERLRVIVDQISSLTDVSARSLHRRLTG